MGDAENPPYLIALPINILKKLDELTKKLFELRSSKEMIAKMNPESLKNREQEFEKLPEEALKIMEEIRILMSGEIHGFEQEPVQAKDVRSDEDIRWDQANRLLIKNGLKGRISRINNLGRIDDIMELKNIMDLEEKLYTKQEIFKIMTRLIDSQKINYGDIKLESHLLIKILMLYREMFGANSSPININHFNKFLISA
jgi:hypothetical protein